MPGRPPLAGLSVADATSVLTELTAHLPPGSSVVRSESTTTNGYAADVAGVGNERLLLKVSFDPRWEATMDGAPVPVLHAAPNFMAVVVPPGEHTVRFRYHSPWSYKVGPLLLLAALFAWGGWRWGSRLRGRAGTGTRTRAGAGAGARAGAGAGAGAGT